MFGTKQVIHNLSSIPCKVDLEEYEILKELYGKDETACDKKSYTIGALESLILEIQ